MHKQFTLAPQFELKRLKQGLEMLGTNSSKLAKKESVDALQVCLRRVRMLHT